EAHLPGEEVDRLVLLPVVLPAERVPSGDVQDLSHEPLGVAPEELVPPGLRTPRRIEPEVRRPEGTQPRDRMAHDSSFPVEDRHRAPGRQPARRGEPWAFRPFFPRASWPAFAARWKRSGSWTGT